MAAFTRHLAGAIPNLPVSPHGWVCWSGVIRKLNSICVNDITQNRILTNIVTDCGGAVHDNWKDTWGCTYDDSWEEPAVGTGSMKARHIFLCDDDSGEMLEICAQHGMSAGIVVSIYVSRSLLPLTALRFAPSFFHMATTAALSFIVMSGLNPGCRVGTMHSLYPPWEPRSTHMQRWGTCETHIIFIVTDAHRILYNMGWRDTDPGLRISEAGACIPDTLPLSKLSKRVSNLNVNHVRTVLQAANQGQTDIDPEVPVGEPIYDSKNPVWKRFHLRHAWDITYVKFEYPCSI